MACWRGVQPLYMKLMKRAISIIFVLGMVLSTAAPVFAAPPEIVPTRAEVHCQVGGRTGVIIEESGKRKVGFETRNCRCEPAVGGMDRRDQYQEWMSQHCTVCDYEYETVYAPYWGEWYHVW